MSYQSEVLADGPVLYWRLGERSGVTAEDATANNRVGTYTNSPTLGVAGALGDDTAITLAAASSQYVRSASYVFNSANATVGAWVKIASTPASAQLIVGCIDGPGAGLADKLLYIKPDGKLYWYGHDGVEKVTSAPTTTLPIGEWVHVAGTADSSTLRAYQNGVEVGSVACGATFTGYTVANVFVTGTTSGSPDDPAYLNGSVDEFALYGSALSAARIAAHYDAAGRFGLNVVRSSIRLA